MQNPTRRRVLAAGLAGTALAVSGRTAVASAPPATPPETSPGRPTAGDVELLGFAQSLEIAARDLFQLAIDEDADGDEDRVLRACRDIHQSNTDAFSAMLGTGAPNARDDAIFDEWSQQFTTSSLEDAAAAGYDFESVVVATHIDLVGELEGLDGARTLAAIITTESRLCTVLADLSGRGDDLDALFLNEADALAPTSANAGGA